MRKLRPCGTHAAYARHLRNNEKPCDACTEANRARRDDAPSGSNNYAREMDRELDANPPVIVWRLDPVRRIQVAWVVDDPYVDHDQKANRLKIACKYGHPFDELNTYIKSDGARECRTCKQRHNDARGRAAA